MMSRLEIVYVHQLLIGRMWPACPALRDVVSVLIPHTVQNAQMGQCLQIRRAVHVLLPINTLILVGNALPAHLIA